MKGTLVVSNTVSWLSLSSYAPEIFAVKIATKLRSRRKQVHSFGASNFLQGEGPKNVYGSLLPWFTAYHVAKFGWVLSAELCVRSPAKKKNAEFLEGG